MFAKDINGQTKRTVHQISQHIYPGWQWNQIRGYIISSKPASNFYDISARFIQLYFCMRGAIIKSNQAKCFWYGLRNQLPLLFRYPRRFNVRIFNKEAFCLTDTKFLRNSDNGSFIVLRICFNTEFTACYKALDNGLSGTGITESFGKASTSSLWFVTFFTPRLAEESTGLTIYG